MSSVEHAGQVNRDTDEMGPLQVIVDDAADRRLADRLVRAGMPVAQISLQALEAPVRGIVYVAAGIRVADVDVRDIVRSGAHLWILPPFPEQSLALATGGEVSIAPAGRRDGVHLSRPILDVVGSSGIPGRPLRILYRDRIAGGISTSLAESVEGEMLAGAMPRMSNLHGQLVVSSLMVGTASAQTDLDDVAIFARALAGWCGADETVPAGDSAGPQQQISVDITDEHDAQLVLLALVLGLAPIQPDTSGSTTISHAKIRSVFERVAALLGETPSEQTLADGLRWLHDHGVFRDVPAGAPDTPDDPMRVDHSKVREFVQMWQLQPRLRRLSRMPLQ